MIMAVKIVGSDPLSESKYMNLHSLLLITARVQCTTPWIGTNICTGSTSKSNRMIFWKIYKKESSGLSRLISFCIKIEHVPGSEPLVRNMNATFGTLSYGYSSFTGTIDALQNSSSSVIPRSPAEQTRRRSSNQESRASSPPLRRRRRHRLSNHGGWLCNWSNQGSFEGWQMMMRASEVRNWISDRCGRDRERKRRRFLCQLQFFSFFFLNHNYVKRHM